MEIKPLWDQVVVERADAVEVSKGGIFIPTTVRETSQEAVVRAVGRGRLLQSGTVIEPSVKVGDKVLLSRNYHFTEVKLDGKDLLIVREDAIAAIIE